jgi:hypothetical protein
MSFSRNPTTVLDDALQKGYARVRFQQGSPVLDRELNLLGDLASPTRLADQYVGNGAPTGSNGFRITNLNVPSNDFTIEAGRCLVGGHDVELRANTTYRTQPNSGNAAPFPPGTSNIYLRVFTRPITEADDADLGNTGPGDVGRVTSVREMVDFEVLVSAPVINARDHLLLASLNLGEVNTVIDQRRIDLTLASVRDEVSGARGSLATMDARLDVSLAENGTLRPNVVGTAQLAVNAVATAQIANTAVTEPKLADNVVSRRTIANGAISLTKLNPTPILDVQVSVPAAPAAGQITELAVDVETADELAFHIVSVRYVSPRPVGLPAPVNFLNFFNWRRRTALVKLPNTLPVTHRHQILLENGNNFAITVACRAYRIAET